MKLLLISGLFCWYCTASGQNCSVNAGIDGTYCLADTVTLSGIKSGLVSGGTTWSQVSGPSAFIQSPNSLNTGVSGLVPGVYTFNLRAKCADQSRANDQVVITILGSTRANAGPDRNFCPQTDTLGGNVPGAGETGTWTFIQNQGNIFITNVNQNNSSYGTIPGNGGISILRWTITNANGCSTSDEAIYTNYGAEAPVYVADSIMLNSCYSTFTSSSLTGSFSGRGLGGQYGTWTALNGPGIPGFINQNSDSTQITNLVNGIYTVVYTVTGPCVNGTDTMKIIVPPPMGELSPSNGFNMFLCDRPKTVVLNGLPPVYANDTCRWIQTSGPTIVSFSPMNAASTTVTGLNGKANSVYNFNYIMTNPNSGCTRASAVTLTYVDTPGLDVFPDRILPCNRDTALLRFNDTGGRFYNYSQVSGPFNTTLGNISTDSISRYIPVTDMEKTGMYTYKIGKSSGFTQGCVSAESLVNIIVSVTPSVSNAGSSQMLLCLADTTEIAGNVPLTGIGTWSQNYGPNQAVIDDSLQNIAKIRNLIPGRYQFRWLINGGQACTPEQDDVEVLVSDSLTNLADAGSDRTICYGAVYRLNGNVPAANESGVWRELFDSTVVFSDSTAYNTLLQNLDSSRTYYFAWRIFNTCGFSEDTVVIHVDSTVAPRPSLAGNDRCLPDTTTLFSLDGNAPWPAKGKWTKLSGPADSIVNDTVFNTPVIPSANGHYIYRWTISNGQCDPTIDDVLITISRPVSTAQAGPDFDTCSNTIQLKGIQAVYGASKWSLLTGYQNGSVQYPDSARTLISQLRQGTYVFRLTNSNGACGTSTDDVRVNVADPPTTPVAELGKIWCNPGSLQLQGNRITKGNGFWTLHGPNPNAPTIQPRDSASATVSGIQAGIYTFRWNAISPYGICPQLFSQRKDTVVFPADAGNNRSLCAISSVQLTGTNGSVGFWRKSAGGSVTLDTTGTNSAVAGNMVSAGSPYTFIYEVNPSYGCPQSIDSMTVSVQDSTRTAFAGYDLVYCNQDTFFLQANNVSPDTGSWSIESGPASGSFLDPDSFGTYFMNPVPGTYLLKWTSRNKACVSSDFVLIRNSDSVVDAYAGNDTIICPDRLNMQANSAGNANGQWQQVSGPGNAVIQSINNPNTLVSSLGVGDYVFTWSISNTICPVKTDTVVVQLPYANPSTAFAGIDSAFCDRDSLRLYAALPTVGRGTWKQLSGDTFVIAEDTLYNTQIISLEQGISTISWTVENGICSNADTVQLTNHAPPSTALAGNDSSYCQYVPVSISAQNPATGTGQWSVLSGSGAVILNPASVTANVSGLVPGTYRFLWSVVNGNCDPSKDTVTIGIDSIPTMSNAGPNQLTCLDSSVMAGNVPVTGIGTWHVVSGIDTPVIDAINNPLSAIYLLDSGKYFIAWEINKGGCSNADTMLLSMQDPNANDQCLTPVQINDPGGLFFGDLCGAKTYGPEPLAAGLPACNTVFYKFRTYGFTSPKSVNIDVQTMNACNNGLRISLFDSAACPGLGSQHDTTVVISTAAYVSFDSLAPNSTYILVFDEFRNPCAKTACNFSFRFDGTALPVELISFDAVHTGSDLVTVDWVADYNHDVMTYEVWKTDEKGHRFVSRVTSSRLHGITEYRDFDREAYYFPVTYYLKAKTVNGMVRTLGEKTLQAEEEKRMVHIYPNPGSDRVVIEPEDGLNGPVTVSVSAYTCQAMIQPVIRRAGDGIIIIDTASWADGIYYFEVQVGQKAYNCKIAIIH